MTNLRMAAAVLGLLTILLGATTAYFYTNQGTSVQTSVSTQTSTTTSVSTVTQTVSGESSNSTKITVGIGHSSNSTIGYYLTDVSGLTLYEFKKDTPGNGSSTCYGQCAAAWPAFSVSSIKAAPGINASAFGTITRKDDTHQVTYNGWPLYYFQGDAKPGDTNGQGLFKVWFAYSLPTAGGSAAPAYTVAIGYSSNSTIGFHLTNGTGFTLYFLKADKPNNGTSACYGDCAKFWPAFYVSDLSLPPGLNASSFATISRTDGAKQLTYNGWPLYYFAPDKKAGDTNGQGVNKVWYAYSLPEPGALSGNSTTTH